MIAQSWKSTAGAAAFVAVAYVLGAPPASADTDSYWHSDQDEKVWRSGFGECWQTNRWTEENAIEECHPDLFAQAEPEPEPEPEPAPEPKLVTMSLGEKTFFEFDRATLTPEARQTLNSLIARMGDLVSVSRVSVTGHADRVGSESYNMGLSQRRADTVAGYLRQNTNVSPGKFQVNARGESEPIVACQGRRGQDLIRCLAPNRRVEIDVVGSQRQMQ